MLYERLLSEKIKEITRHFPVLVLTGARQTGKTTLLKNLFPEHNYISLDVPSRAEQAEKDPDTFLTDNPAPLLIDEVQYAPKLFRHLKSRIDEHREQNGRYILTGSQKFTLMKEVSDSLAGRAGLLELETLAVSELGHSAKKFIEDFSSTKLLSRGFYPQLWKDQELSPDDFYSSYLATYIERDVRLILNISSLRDFERFIRACAARSGQLLNKSEIARDVGITAVTANDWLSVLEASNQITLLEPYFGNVTKRLVKSPKLYINDTGLLCFLLGLSAESLQNSHMIGAVWETFIFAELRKIFSTSPRTRVWFYGDRQIEVDFLIDVDGKISLSESKWSETPNAKDAVAIQKASSVLDKPIASAGVICRTPNSFPLQDNIFAVSGFSLASFMSEKASVLS